MNLTYPEERFQAHIQEIIDEVLGVEKIRLRIENFSLHEKNGISPSVVEGDLVSSYGTVRLHSSGSGIMDALFNALVATYQKEYYCFENVEFEDFSVKVRFKEGKKRSKIDAPVEITLILQTAKKTRLYFRSSSPSLTSAAIDAVLKSIEFLVNCERAVIALCLDISTLRKAKKQYLIDPYVIKLAELVKAANFEKTVGAIQC